MLASDAAQITIACLGLVGVIAAATIPVVILRSGQKDIRATLGTPNSGHENIADQNQTQLDELAAVRVEQAAHADLDERRFRAVHQHLGIPFDTTTQETP